MNITIPVWLVVAAGAAWTLISGAISFAVNQVLVKGAVDRMREKQKFDTEDKIDRYTLSMRNREATTECLREVCDGIERFESETGQKYWNGAVKRKRELLDQVDEEYKEADRNRLAVFHAQKN